MLSVDGQADTLGDRQGVFLGGVDQQQGKLLTANAGSSVIHARMVLQHRGGKLDHLVAGDVAVVIIDAFEMIEVTDNH